MTKTLTSGTTSYCSPASFAARWDARSVMRLLTDDGATYTAAQAAAAVLTNATLGEILKEASGMVESACLAGGKYSAADLLKLLDSGASPAVLTNAGATLAGLVADLAMWRVWDRRPTKDGPLPKRCELAFALLDQLRDGARIFGFAEAEAAGRLDHQRTTADEAQRRGGAELILARYFGRRGDRDPRNFP